ncbi:receptor binding protein 1 [Campylobacter phage F336]|uniref:Receptor binding protein 1 n=1 Tax=Campylobacter phage F336 TaxID=2794361 RepID=A0A7T3KD16_9CAUD|nr:receptor binding protein 1 [Campylobacter phage F336]
MAYGIDNVWSFVNDSQTGIDKVPVNKIVLLKDINKLYLKKQEGGLTPSSTVREAVANKSLVSLSSDGSLGTVDSNIKVIDDPNFTTTDNMSKGKKMYKIPIKSGTVVQVLGLYIENSANSSIDAVAFDYIIKNNNVVVYTNNDTTPIKKLIYSESTSGQTNLDSLPKLLTENLTWTVGTNGTFSNLLDALKEASKYVSITNYTITIQMKSSYKLTESIHINNANLGHVILTSEDEYVEFDGSMSANPAFINQYVANPIAMSYTFGISPIISFKLRFSAVPGQFSMAFGFLQTNFKLNNSGVYNAKWGVGSVGCIGLVQNSTFENCTESGVVADNGSILNVYENNTFKNCSGNILWSADGSKIYGGNVVFDGLYNNNNSICCCANITSEIALNVPTFKNINNMSSYALGVSFGGRISCTSNIVVSGLNKTNITENIFTSSGVITFN